MTTSSFRSFSQLGPPRHWFHGLCQQPPALPLNVIAFSRQIIPPSLTHVDFHHRMVLLIALKGKGLIRVDDERLNLLPNHALLIFPFQYHAYLSAHAPLLWFYITFTLEPTDRYQPLRLHPVPLSPFMRAICTRFAQLYPKAQSAPVHSPVLIFLLASLLEEMLHNAPLPSSPPPDRKLSEKQQKVQAACRLIYEQLSRPLSIAELARTLSLSPSTLRVSFKEITGLSLGSFITRVRLCEAAVLLHGTLLEVKEIAQSVGYRSVASFIRTFRRMTGRTPLQFRQSGCDPSALKPFLTFPEDR